ncbi:hypothetical protein I311_04400 [Cryptococcus gattii NT-10]|nr:hypothetical protein I311_04400 [Cryptococcus gattii NT-10]
MPPSLNNFLSGRSYMRTTTSSSSRDLSISNSMESSSSRLDGSPLLSLSARSRSASANLRTFFVPSRPTVIVTPVREPLTTLEGTASAEMLSNLILHDLQAIKGRSHNIPKTLREEDFESHSSFMRALGEHLPRTLGEVAEQRNKIDWLTSSLISSFAINKSYQQSLSELKSEVHYLRQKLSAMGETRPNDEQERPRKRVRNSRSTEVVGLVHRSVRTLLGLRPCGPKQTYSPEDWPDYDPIMAPNGYYQDAGTNFAVWRPNWDHLKCHFYQNLVNAAVDVCLRDASVSSMPSREELCKKVKDYLEGIAKMKKRPKAERDTNRLLKTIRARVNPVRVY